MAEVLTIGGRTFSGPQTWLSRNFRAAFIKGAEAATEGGEWAAYNPYKRALERQAFTSGARAFERAAPGGEAQS